MIDAVGDDNDNEVLVENIDSVEVDVNSVVGCVVLLTEVVGNDDDDEVPVEDIDSVEVDVNSKESVVGCVVLLIEVVGDDNGDEVSFDVDIAGVVAAKPDDEYGAVDTLYVDN